MIKTERCQELVAAFSTLSCHDTILREEAISIYDVGVWVVFYMDLYGKFMTYKGHTNYGLAPIPVFEKSGNI